MLKYLANLRLPMVVLWCYFLWYLYVLIGYFQLEYPLWLTAVGLALIVGLAHNLNARSGTGHDRKSSPWVVFRFYLIPFCVSSYAGMVRGKGFFMIFSPSLLENLIGGSICLTFLALVAFCRQRHAKANAPGGAI